MPYLVSGHLRSEAEPLFTLEVEGGRFDVQHALRIRKKRVASPEHLCLFQTFSVGATEALTKAQRFIANRATSSMLAFHAGMATATPLAPCPFADDEGLQKKTRHKR